MGTHTEKAACIGGPIAAADATGITGVFRYAATGTAQNIALPLAADNPQKKSTLGGRFLAIRPVGCSIQWAQGRGAAPTIVSNQVSTFAAPSAGAGASLADGERQEVILDALATHLGVLASAGTGFIEIYLAETSGRP